MDNACTTSTHRALVCQEIVENVCEFLDPYQLNEQLRQGAERPKHRSTLVKLAHTCKSFSDPALRVLWRHLGGISHLLRVLPQYMPARSDDAFNLDWGPGQQTISCEPADHDWARLQSYAVRVREFKYWQWSPIDNASLKILCKMCNGKPLLPRLERLQLDFELGDSHDSDALLLKLLVSPSLRRLTFSIGDWLYRSHEAGQYQEAVQNIVSRAPELRHLSVRTGISSSTLLYPIKSLQFIQKLSFPDDMVLDGVLLTHCASLSPLRDLSCRIDTRQFKYPDIKGAFPDLSRISLHGCVQDIVWFFQEISVDSLRDISLFFYGQADVGELVRSVQEVLRLFPSSLRRFSLEMAVSFRTPLPLVLAMEPLLKLRSLEAFKVHARRPGLIAIAPDGLLRMATAWPDICTLHISDYNPYYSVSLLPADVLESVALRCPCLESLKLPILDFTRLPPQAQEPLLGHGLVDLEIHLPRRREPHDSEMESTSGDDVDLLNAALFIDRLFPRLALQASDPRAISLTDNGVDARRKNKFTKLLIALRAGRENAVASDRLRVAAGEEPYGGPKLDPVLL